jgi:hypothetical protein
MEDSARLEVLEFLKKFNRFKEDASIIYSYRYALGYTCEVIFAIASTLDRLTISLKVSDSETGRTFTHRRCDTFEELHSYLINGIETVKFTF